MSRRPRSSAGDPPVSGLCTGPRAQSAAILQASYVRYASYARHAAPQNPRRLTATPSKTRTGHTSYTRHIGLVPGAQQAPTGIGGAYSPGTPGL